MLDLSAPALNQLKEDDAKNLVAFYMETPGLTKTHEWSADATAKIEVPQTQPSVLRASAPTPGGGSTQRRQQQAPTAETAPSLEEFANPPIETPEESQTNE